MAQRQLSADDVLELMKVLTQVQAAHWAAAVSPSHVIAQSNSPIYRGTWAALRATYRMLLTHGEAAKALELAIQGEAPNWIVGNVLTNRNANFDVIDRVVRHGATV